MGPDDSSEPSIYADFRHVLPGTQLERLGRFEFYAWPGRPALAIATGEQRLYANVLLTIGVRPPDGPLVPSGTGSNPSASGDGRRAFRYRLALGPTRASRSISASGDHLDMRQLTIASPSALSPSPPPPARRPAARPSPPAAPAARSRASIGASAPSPCRGR